MVLRNPSSDEMRLLVFLIRKVGCIEISSDLLARLKVADMDDGGMGSLRLFPEGFELQESMFGKPVSACQFTDADGIEVIVSLNIDRKGNLYELDMWKTNFARLIRIPQDTNDLHREGAAQIERNVAGGTP